MGSAYGAARAVASTWSQLAPQTIRRPPGVGNNAGTPAPMTAENQTSPVARASELLQRGPELAPGRPPRGLRGALRWAVLRALGPYAHHQRELDGELVAAMHRLWQSHQHVAERHGEQIERLEQLMRELILTAESLRRAAGDAAEGAAEAAGVARRALGETVPVVAELHELPYIAGSPFESFHTPVGEAVGFRARPPDAGGQTSAYAAFEDIFRGPAERVAESQRPYLPLLREHQPVLDVGCGRGELLTLLAAEGVAASGVDGDEGMVERCRALGLEVALRDVNEYLESVAEGSLGAVFSAQVIEHLPYPELRRTLALALRALRPGGVWIAETVNPHRIASLKTFWVDLTHQHPIFPEVALALCGIAGFSSAYVFAPGFEDFERARFQAPSYAVVASAPS
jgi:2-polyprenyl-3-methyl-5-hydroxy-6-metoxy-1,4-benzoquinol methylase